MTNYKLSAIMSHSERIPKEFFDSLMEPTYIEFISQKIPGMYFNNPKYEFIEINQQSEELIDVEGTIIEGDIKNG